MSATQTARINAAEDLARPVSLKTAERVVIKVGSSLVTNEGRGLDEAAIASWAAQIAALRALGAPAVLLKGGHLADGGAVVDILVDDQGEQRTTHPRLDLDAHGTGCTLASAVAANLARGLPLRAACAAAADYVHAALAGGYRPGRSAVVVLDHFAILPGR